MMVFTYVIAGLILLGLCIFVHELGHLLGGKMVGIKAKVFSLGYGKGIIKKKIGDTTYQITPIPLGGYCQFYGEDPSEERTGKEFEFLSAHPLKRIVTVAMGPLFNLFFGIILFFVMNLVGYTKETNRVYIPRQYESGKDISPASKAGIKNGDKIVEINGSIVQDFTDIRKHVFFSDGKSLDIKVERNNKPFNMTVQPRKDDASGRYAIGLTPFGKHILIAGLSEHVKVASKAGLIEMDEIKTVDGTEINDIEEFTTYINGRANKTVHLKIIRKGEEKDIDVIPELTDDIKLVGRDKKSKEMHFDKELLEPVIKKKGVTIDGQPVKSYNDFIAGVNKDNNKIVTIKRGKEEYQGTVTIGKKAKIGIFLADIPAPEMIDVKYGISEAFVRALIEPYDFIVMNLKGIGMIFTGRINVRENLSGPVRIFKFAGDVAYYRGIAAFIILMAQISIILMVMNLLPIPVVDGSHIIFFFIELIRGKPINDKIMEKIQTVGIIILIMLGAFVIFNDIYMLPAIQKLFN